MMMMMMMMSMKMNIRMIVMRMMLIHIFHLHQHPNFEILEDEEDFLTSPPFIFVFFSRPSESQNISTRKLAIEVTV